jgi:osmotically-inducible protein OsmY
MAKRQLREREHYSIRSIRCDFHEGILTLRGCLATFYLKQVAQTLVTKVEGVQLIDNRVEVPEPSVRS